MRHMLATAPADLSELLQNIAVWDPVQQRYIQKPEATRSGNSTPPPRFLEGRPPFLASSIGDSASALLPELPSSLLEAGSSRSLPPSPSTGKRKRSVGDDGAEKEVPETKHHHAEDEVEGEDEDQPEVQVEGEEGGLTELDRSSETELQFSDDLDNVELEIEDGRDSVVVGGDDDAVDNEDESEPEHDDKDDTSSIPDTFGASPPPPPSDGKRKRSTDDDEDGYEEPNKQAPTLRRRGLCRDSQLTTTPSSTILWRQAQALYR
jgi:hypothetical protein